MFAGWDMWKGQNKSIAGTLHLESKDMNPADSIREYQKEFDSLKAPCKRLPIYPLQCRQLNFYHSTLSQPLPVCETCFASPISPLRRVNYVNVLDFPLCGGLPSPVLFTAAPRSRWLADIRYTISTPIPHSYPSVTQRVLHSQRVANTTELIAAAENSPLRVIKKRAVRFVFEMKANFSKLICKVVAYILFKVFRRIMSHLLVCPAQMEQLQQADKSGIPILYLPLHRSHLDYLLITWTLWHWGLRLPHVASGDNLNLSGFGWLLRATGAFFIRRRVGDTNSAGCDQLYRSVLNSYMCEVLREGIPIEFFLEGTRSRFGKALPPKNGLISNVVAAVQQDVIKDVWMVPVSFTYDHTAEGIFFNELMGMRKQRESVWRVFKGVVQSLGSGRCGAVRINFGTPVLLTSYMMSLKGKLSRSQGHFTLKHELRTHSYRELLPWHYGSDTPGSTLIRSIGYHIIYDAQMQSSLSVCSLLSALMICKYRGKVRIECLLNDLVCLCNVIVELGFDIVGWDSENTDGHALLQRGIVLLSDSLVQLDETISMRCSHQDTLHLAYHKNALVPVFSIISVVSLAMLTLRSAKCTEMLLVEMSLLACDLLQYEVLFCKPCEDLKKRIGEVILRMKSLNGGLLRIESDISSPGDAFISVLNEEAECMLLFYSNILRPFLQSMYIVLDSLTSLTTPFEGKGADFVRTLLSRPANGFITPFALLAEAVNADSFNNALRLFREKGLLAVGPVVAVGNPEGASTLLQSLKTLLCDSQ
uniref:Glycerol-3-phosphate acyltransferase n=1 Tax=Ascaris suum TaxID=6253 RepID=F1KT36_ASCSU